MGTLVKRSDKVAFYGVKSENDVTYKRMRGFTDMSINRNPKEYTRKYIDEKFEQSDIVGFSPAISFTFDSFLENDVQNDILSISENELLGEDAVREIVIVDLKRAKDEGFHAVKRTFSVIVESEGNSDEAYQMSGTFKVKGEKEFGIATSNDEWETLLFTKSEDEI